jgi:hypothetical protein
MTRDPTGYVTFWESCNRRLYHLPGRCKKGSKDSQERKKHVKNEEATEEVAVADEDEEDEDPMKNKVRWEGEAPDTSLQDDDIKLLPMVGRTMPQPKKKAANKARKGDADPRMRMMEEARKRKNTGPTAPRRELLSRESDLLVTCLPYHSVDFVFNDKTLYANRRNPHPACIMYDWDDGWEMDSGPKGKKPWWSWLPFPAEDDTTAGDIEPKAQKVALSEPLRAQMSTYIKKNIKEEVEQNIELYRTKKGLDTKWDRSEQLVQTFQEYLEILEKWQYIDMDFEGIDDLFLKREEYAAEVAAGNREHEAELFIVEHLTLDRWNTSPLDPKESILKDRYEVRSPWRTGENHTMKEHPTRKLYAVQQEETYASLLKMIKKFLIRKNNIVVARGKRLRGVPLHFSTSEPEKIREYLQTCGDFNEFKDSGSMPGQALEDVFFTVACIAERLAGSILSVWFYIAIQEPEPED